MPTVQIHLLKGRTKDQKRLIAKEVSEALSRTADTPVKNVKIIFSEMELEDYAIGGEILEDIRKSRPDV